MQSPNPRLDELGLREAIELARSLGYEVVFDWLDGCGGGKVVTDGTPWILIDDMQPADEQLAIIQRVLGEDQRLQVLAFERPTSTSAKRHAA